MRLSKRDGIARRHAFDKSGGEKRKHPEPAPAGKMGKLVHHIRRMPRH
ncbi:MAG TPA: hypothetical protein VMZ92_07085 [Planctomycetota bacterium]|nr:hypothetical protein [Planctomycetota bacterium]